ncbi:MAG: site-specific integrase [Gammaproteobacteria bacterium]|nr:site-specific integrase [Gammaproteobacteria bacterium]
MRHNLKNFELKEACSLTDPKLESTYELANPLTGKVYRLGEKPLKIFATPSVTIKNLPTVIGSDGLPWDLACYYLLGLAEQQASDLASIQKYAVHLSEFYDFCQGNDVDLLLDTPSKRKKPIFRFRDSLLGQVRDGEITDKTANNKIGNVVRFYRWLIDDHGFVFKHRPFNNESVVISFVNASGNIGHKLTHSHNARIKTSPNAELPSEDVIVDDGRLRPLPANEQEVLLNTLVTHKNTEMFLIFMFSLTTGARIQSVLTVRHKHFRVETDPDTSVPLAIGHGTAVDSKYSKKQTLVIPTFVQQKLAAYSHSERAKKRFLKYCDKRQIEPMEEAMDDCYLFLSNQGHPFYDAKSDLYKADHSQERTNLRNGDSVRKFIKRRLLPPMKEAFGQNHHFQFHDLRATFGMNLVDACMNLVDKGQMPVSEVLPFVQSRMNHANSKTTQLYINYREKNKKVAQIIDEYQSSMLDRIESLLGGKSLC